MSETLDRVLPFILVMRLLESSGAGGAERALSEVLQSYTSTLSSIAREIADLVRAVDENTTRVTQKMDEVEKSVEDAVSRVESAVDKLSGFIREKSEEGLVLVRYKEVDVGLLEYSVEASLVG